MSESLTTYKKRIFQYVRTHLIACVILALIVIWITVSAGVYLAEKGQAGANIDSFGKAIWWGVVTFLTVGYGDFTPVTAAGRVMAGFLMFAGVFATAIVTSKISSYFMEQVLREGRGMIKTSSLNNHFVVCGWKEDMHQLLNHILAFNPELNASDLVLIANLSPAIADSLHEQEGLKNLQIVIGNYYEMTDLKRAAPERARKVLILADRTPNPNGSVPSMTEVDARTIMTAMTLSTIARGTPVAAEVLDVKMDQYLKIASVSEIIYSREYSRLLLGNAAGGTGVSNIIFDLLDPKTPTLINSAHIPEGLLGLAYPEFKKAFEKLHPSSVVIGILENTGNRHSIKELALRQAQKTPDISRLVRNLKSVKELQCNHPIFSPGPEYIVPEGGMAIIIETRGTKNAGAETSPESVAA